MTQYPQDPQYGPPPGWQPPAPPPKTHTVRNVILVLFGLGILGLVGCVAIVGGAVNDVSKKTNTVHTVVYKVTGTGQSASLITYTTDAVGSTEQFSDAALPWSKTFTIKGGLVYQVMAQNGDTGRVICAIEVDGLVVKTATGEGASSIAHCTYTP